MRSTAARSRWCRAGPTPRASPWGRAPTWCRRRSATTRRAPARRRRARDGTSTSSSSTRRAGAARVRRRHRPRPARRRCRPRSPGLPPTVTQTSSHIDSHRRQGDGGDAAVRARPRPERQQGLAGRGLARARSAGRFASRRPRAAPARRRVRQRLARHRGRPARSRAAPASRWRVTWTPQQLVWLALAVSGATLLLCLVLGFLPVRSRRWLRAAPPAAPAPRPGRPRRAGAAVGPVRRAVVDAALLGPHARRAAGAAGCASRGRWCSVRPPAGWPCSWRRRWPRWRWGVLVALGLVLPWARAAGRRSRGSRSSSPAASTWSRGSGSTTTCRARTGTAFFVHAGNLIWIGVVLLVADAVISSFGLRVRKPVRRRELQAVAVGARWVGRRVRRRRRHRSVES